MHYFFAGGLKGQKVVIAGSNQVANSTANTIKIVKVGNQARKTIAIMPSSSKTVSTTTSSSPMVSTISPTVVSTQIAKSVAHPTTKESLKRQLEELQAEIENDRLALQQKMAKLKKIEANLEQDDNENNTDEAEQTVVQNIIIK